MVKGSKNIINDNLFVIIAVALIIFSFVLIYVSLYWGVGLTPDSLVYIRAAENLAGTSPGTASQHYPPLYSYFLFLSSIAFSDSLNSAKWSAILLYLFTIIVLAVVLKKANEQGNGWILAGIFTIFTAPHIFSVYMMAWSEPLFILLSLVGFYQLSVFLSLQKKSSLVYSAALLALAFLTRYVGIVPIGAALLSLVIFSHQPVSERFKSAALLGLLSFAPMILWMGWGQLSRGAGSPRSFAFHPVTAEKLNAGLDEVMNWFLLTSPVSWVVLSVFLVSYIYLTSGCRPVTPSTASGADYFRKILFTFIPLYLGFLVLSISFFDAHTPLDSRILLPVYFFLVTALTLGLSSTVVNSPLCKLFNISAFLVVLLLISLQVIQLQGMVNYFSKNGVGFLSRQWVQSDTLAYMKDKQAGRQHIYTNSPEIIEIHLKKESKFLPQRESATSKKANEDYLNAMNRLRQDMINNDAILVYFYAFSYRRYLPGLPELSKYLEVDVLYRGRDGIVLQAHK